MVTTGALLHGDVPRHLDFDAESIRWRCSSAAASRDDLAACAQLAQRWGYDEINLNCGCPSERVQRGAFGACLMAEPPLVADCVKAMRDAVDAAGDGQAPHRHRPRRELRLRARLRRHRGRRGGCEVFIVHARNAWLKGLSPKENREMPPLRYDFVHRLKRDFPQLTIVLNGGIAGDAGIAEQLQHVDGVMLGREAYHNPWSMAGWDRAFLGRREAAPTREEVEARWSPTWSTSPRRRAVVARDAPRARPAQRRAGRTPLAPALVGSPPAARAAAARCGARRRGPAGRCDRIVPDSVWGIQTARCDRLRQSC